MKAGELIAIVDSIKQNEISEDVKFAWLNEAEARELCEIRKEPALDMGAISCGESELSVPSPYSKMYSMYLVAMIAFVLGEYDTYAKANAEYEQVFYEYAKYCIRTR